MTSGFWKGLLHGGLISAGALAVLSLVSPMPQPADAPVDQPVEPVGSAETGTTGLAEQSRPADQGAADGPEKMNGALESGSGDEIATAPEPAAPALVDVPPVDPEPLAAPDDDVAGRPGEAPVASAVDLPVGSEFGRGGDRLPNLPTPLDVPQGSMGQTEAPGVIAPAAEPAPVTIAVNDARPDAANAAPSALTTNDAEAAPEFDQPKVLAAPAAPSAPELSRAAQPDSVPDMSAFSGVSETFSAVIEDDPNVTVHVIEPIEPAAARETEQGEAMTLPGTAPEPERVPMSEVSSEPEATVPVQQSQDHAPDADGPVSPPVASTSLDLSLPPDITELRNMERD
ncbi:hypothetical protein H4P12_01810 [Paracoccus sp. 11-3]|uniref:Uncharacterized protein n=1 Tax=Paracoccus amoyensis TaxID=2760093 RepID=A0A926G4C6_9RHOB|nr:hypothetical protein [Paracoccus amoyensis]MBC9245473.1 hypothetical protein [Paracoccus amoyensis]